MSDSLRPHESQHTRPPHPSPTPGVHWDSCPSSQWCHPAISSSVIPFSSCPQPLPVSESFPMSQLFTWGGQSTGVSTLASFLPKKSQGWSPSEWTGWISLQSKGLSRVFSNTTVQKHQFFGAQLSSFILVSLNNLEMIWGIWENVHSSLYANTVTFYIRSWAFVDFGIHGGFSNPTPAMDTKGRPYTEGQINAKMHGKSVSHYEREENVGAGIIFYKGEGI